MNEVRQTPGPGDPIPNIPVEGATVACWGCKQVLRTEGGVTERLGDLQDYDSVRRPVSGWVACDACRRERK